MSLTHKKCEQCKFDSSGHNKLADGGGLYLNIMPSGAKIWRQRYRFQGKENVLTHGRFPMVSLAQAREKRDGAKKLILEGSNPSSVRDENRRIATLKASNSFELVAREWLENRKDAWTKGYATYVVNRLEADVFPDMGSRLVSEIAASELLAVLRKVEKRGTKDLQHRILQTCSQIFRYAIITGRAENNPAPQIQGALKVVKKEHHAYLSAKEMPEFMKKLSEYDGDKTTQLALKLIILTFLRTTELRAAEWTEIDFEKAEWRIPASRMKMKETHIVPLAKQSLNILEHLKKLSGKSSFVFPSRSNAFKCMSNNTMLFALYRMGYHNKATVHGFRSTASTMLNELGYRSDVIERQLSHGERNKIRAAYNHAQYLPERRVMMQGWADYLEEVIGGGNVIVRSFGKNAMA